MGVGHCTVVQVSGPSLVILAAGRARRYGGVKQLAPVGLHGEGVIDLIASDAYAAGFEDIVIVINPETGPEIVDHVGEFWPKGRKVSFTFQRELRGYRPTRSSPRRTPSTRRSPLACQTPTTFTDASRSVASAST